MGHSMTLQTQHTANAPATLTDEQRQRVSDALKNAQSENTRRNYAGQHRKFRAWCEREGQSALPASPEVVAAYAAELVAEGKSMSTIRLAVSAIIDVHNRRVDLEWPVNAGVSVTLRGSARQLALARSGRSRSMRRRWRRSGQLCSHSLPEHVHGVRQPTDFFPRSWQEARGPSTALSPCRHSFQTRQQRSDASRNLCSQVNVLMYSST